MVIAVPKAGLLAPQVPPDPTRTVTRTAVPLAQGAETSASVPSLAEAFLPTVMAAGLLAAGAVIAIAVALAVGASVNTSLRPQVRETRVVRLVRVA